MKPDMRLTKTKQAEFRAEARRLIADYMYSEGCSANAWMLAVLGKRKEISSVFWIK